jgi:hypothetical protein
MSSAGAAQRVAVPVSSARAEASRKNGARSHGPKTPEGKARSAQNALKHGLRAQKYVVLPDEDIGEFAALEAALIEELAPVGALQGILVGRIARAAWRLERAERIEVELFAERRYGNAGPGLALIRDGNGTRSFDTLLRYRGAAQAELMRALRTLKALQAEAAAALEGPAGSARHARAKRAAPRPPARISARPMPERPEPRRKPSEPGRISDPKEPEPHPNSTRPELDRRLPEPGALCNPSEPEANSRPTSHWLARPRSSGSKTTSSLMPSGSMKKTA